MNGTERREGKKITLVLKTKTSHKTAIRETDTDMINATTKNSIKDVTYIKYKQKVLG